MTDTVYFSVDVETTGPTPSLGSLLSIGIIAFTYDPEQDLRDQVHNGVPFYATIKTAVKDLVWTEETWEWWQQQSPARWREARSGQRDAAAVAQNLVDYVEYVMHDHPEGSEPCFVANPVAFDWPWVNDLLLNEVGLNPFGYRALCIRSMHYGVEPLAQWGADRTTWDRYSVQSAKPHNALADARAQALELGLLLHARHQRAITVKES